MADQTVIEAEDSTNPVTAQKVVRLTDLPSTAFRRIATILLEEDKDRSTGLELSLVCKGIKSEMYTCLWEIVKIKPSFERWREVLYGLTTDLKCCIK